ncbi:MAG TPA: hypothetical protein VIL16_00265 [Trebonia sp.]
MAVLARHPAIVSFLDMVRAALGGGWRRSGSAQASLDGTVGQIRAAHHDIRILAVTQPGAGASAFPALEVTLAPGDPCLGPRTGRRSPGCRLTPPRSCPAPARPP